MLGSAAAEGLAADAQDRVDAGLAATAAVLDSAARLAGLGCWSWEPATGAVDLSPQAEALFGFGPGEFDGRMDTWLRHVRAEDRDALPAIEALVRQGQRTFAWEYRFSTPAGAQKRLKSDGEVLPEREGTRLRLVGTVIQLAGDAAHAELKSFAHTLAHDVRAPLAVIDGFGRRLEECLAETGSETERHYVNRMREAAGRLESYVEALLSQARISQATLRRVTVDLSAMAHEVLAELHVREPLRQVRTFVQAGVATTGDPTLLRIVLENLLGNAWKFTRRREAAEIRFTKKELPGNAGIRCCVSDNGAGFDMQYAGKLFQSFQRLHSQLEFPGTGIGLANVARIVARHGGCVWGESQEERGASFYFTLPR